MTSKIDLRGISDIPGPCPYKDNYNVGCFSTIKRHPEISVQYICMCDSDERSNPECYGQEAHQ